MAFRIACLVSLLSACVALPGCSGTVPEEVESAINGGDGTDPTPIEASGTIVDDEIVVAITPGAQTDDLESLFSDVGVTVRDRLTAISLYRLGVNPAAREAVSALLADSPLIEGVYGNRVIVPDPQVSQSIAPIGWHLVAIEASDAWSSVVGDSDTPVAVIDTGIDIEHRVLESCIVSGGNVVDGIGGWDDDDGHGTAVAGLISSTVEGLAAAVSVTANGNLISIRASDDNETTSWSVATGIHLAVSLGAKIINVSFGPFHDDTVVLREAAIARKQGALVIISAGNGGEYASVETPSDVLFVGAVDSDLRRSTFSNYGNFIDLVAPGEDVYSTEDGNTYGVVSGTSYAAPIVSGVASLVWSVNPNLTPAAVEGILLATATDLGADGDDDEYGAGIVNAGRALELAQGLETLEDTTAPMLSFSYPSDGDRVAGEFVAKVEVADDSDLAEIVVYVDNTPIATDSIAPYAVLVDSGQFAVGTHRLWACATDVFGNATTESIDVTFSRGDDDEDPVVRIIAPDEGDIVAGLMTVIAEAKDNEMLAHAELLVDGDIVETVSLCSEESRIAMNWNPQESQLASGIHTLTVRVEDGAGNSASTSVDVQVAR